MLRLKEILKKKGLNQLFLAKALDLSNVTISSWATGKSMPSVESLIRLCEILDVGLDDLVIIEKSKKKSNPKL
jgi:transcriptional regulator with XRE-family HTH domain